jgi:hypothetical protein
LTVHDSIYTTTSDFDKLEAEWNVQLQKLFELLPLNEISQEEINNVIKKEMSMDIEEIEELDFDDAPVSLINDRHLYVLDEFDDFPDEGDDDFYMKL